jgi:hypothetical protein
MKAALMLVGPSLLLAGCGSAPLLSSAPPDCDPTSSITVQHGPGRLVMMPVCINVTEGSSVTLSFSPTPAMGARTKHKGPGNGWLNRRTDQGPDPSRIVIEVPPGSGGGGNGRVRPYDYNIYVEGVGMLDPRIVVQ